VEMSLVELLGGSERDRDALPCNNEIRLRLCAIHQVLHSTFVA